MDITDPTPKPIDPQLVRDVDVVVTLGHEARVEHPPGTRFETWETDEPSERGIDRIERMRLVRGDIAAPAADLDTRMHVGPRQLMANAYWRSHTVKPFGGQDD